MLTITNLVKGYKGARSEAGRVLAVNDISLDVQAGELFTLLGPSGCGKTTTLRAVAGLEVPDSGRIEVGGRTLFDSSAGINVPANKRGLGMVFQSYAIWPHMSVAQNVAFPLEVRKRKEALSRSRVNERVERVLDVVRLGHLADRQATDLSGGQQQRLALARALVMEPPLLLLDEPLSNLDAKLREEMRFEIKRLQSEVNITAVYVTHDQTEALALSSRIAVMSNGSVEQVGTPQDVYNHPSSHFVADFIGTSNFFDAMVDQAPGDDKFLLASPQGALEVSTSAHLKIGDVVTVSVRPEHISITAPCDGPSTPGVWAGEVVSRAFMGDVAEYLVRVGGRNVRVRSHPSQMWSAGEKISLAIQPDQCTLLPRTSSLSGS